MNFPSVLKDLGFRIFTGEYAFESDVIPKVLKIIQTNNWVILGGDVLNLEGKHTYDNWFYNPDWTKSIEYNVAQGILKTEQYIKLLEERNGKKFRYVLVITDKPRNYDYTT